MKKTLEHSIRDVFAGLKPGNTKKRVEVDAAELDWLMQVKDKIIDHFEMQEGAMKERYMDIQQHAHDMMKKHNRDLGKAKEEFLKKYPSDSRLFHATVDKRYDPTKDEEVNEDQSGKLSQLSTKDPKDVSKSKQQPVKSKPVSDKSGDEGSGKTNNPFADPDEKVKVPGYTKVELNPVLTAVSQKSDGQKNTQGQKQTLVKTEGVVSEAISKGKVFRKHKFQWKKKVFKQTNPAQPNRDNNVGTNPTAQARMQEDRPDPSIGYEAFKSWKRGSKTHAKEAVKSSLERGLISKDNHDRIMKGFEKIREGEVIDLAVKRRERQHTGEYKDAPVSDRLKKKLALFARINAGVHKHATEDEEIMTEAKRGRPKKNSVDDHEHIIMQYRKAKSLGSYPIKFSDGSTRVVHRDEATAVLHHYGQHERTHEKDSFARHLAKEVIRSRKITLPGSKKIGGSF